MEGKHFTRLQRYIVRFAINEQDAKETINALLQVDWQLLYTIQTKDAPPVRQKRKQESTTYQDKKSLLQQRQERAEELRQLPYAEYLKTQYWHTRRIYAIKRAKERCQICNAGDVMLNVHHRTYERLGCELNSDIIVLCEKCHETFHKAGKLAK